MRRAAALGLALAFGGCDSGFGVRVDIAAHCVPFEESVEVDIQVMTQPGSRMEVRSVTGTFLGKEPKVVVVPPHDATMVSVKVAAHRGPMVIAIAAIDVPVEGHKLVSTTLILNGPGCGDAGVPDLGGADFAPPSDLALRCDKVPFCGGATPDCEPVSGLCVECLSDDKCPAGAVCDVKAMKCIPGCNAMHPCGDAGACIDGGMCKFCTQDADCAKPTGKCLKSAGACVQCLSGTDCANGEVCVGNVCRTSCLNDGECMQPPFSSCCSMACVDKSTDLMNCGGCGIVCQLPHATAKCQGGCKILACDQGFGDCDGMAGNGCEINLNTNAQHCLGCGKVCNAPNATSKCSGGCQVAQCNAGFADCDGQYGNGCEIDTRSDAGNCNGCGKVCNFPNGQPNCVNGTCGGTCNGGFGNCNANVLDGCEASLLNDHDNCGVCGKKCAMNQLCVNGACQNNACGPGTADCDMNGSCEANLNDPMTCGNCFNDCTMNGWANVMSYGCNAGSCTIVSCDPGFGNCNNIAPDGCEASFDFDPNNCGMCGVKCVNGQVCKFGICIDGGGGPDGGGPPPDLSMPRDDGGMNCPALCLVFTDPWDNNATYTICSGNCQPGPMMMSGVSNGCYHPADICMQWGFNFVMAQAKNNGNLCGSCTLPGICGNPNFGCNMPSPICMDGHNGVQGPLSWICAR